MESAVTIDDADISNILELAWQGAARINPMVLTKLRPDFDFDSLRQMIKDCLIRGLSAQETCDRAIRELLRSAASDSQPPDTCDDAKRREEQSVL
jgi:hypothetical protein